MTYAPTLATGNGSQVDFSFTFPYLSPLDVKVTINAVPTTAFTFFSASILRFAVAPVNGAAIVIFRETPSDTLSTVIQPGSALPVDGLNSNFLQSLYFNQEIFFNSANQSTAGLQAQITTANNNASNAVVTANAASATASGLAGSTATANANASSAVSTAGTANTNALDALVEAGNATAAATAARSAPPIRNLIQNGSFEINEIRGTTLSTPAGVNSHVANRWRADNIVGSLMGIQTFETGGPAVELPQFQRISVTSADASIAAGDFYSIYQVIEGRNARPLGWGTASPQPAVLTFWVRSSVAGTYGVSFQSNTKDRSYVAPFSVVTPSTWEFKTISLTGPTSGTWNYTSGRGLQVRFCLAAGTTFQGTLDTWNTADRRGFSGMSNFMASSGRTFDITGVQLEAGTAPTAFELQPIDSIAQTCLRYYHFFPNVNFNGNSNSAEGIESNILSFPTVMRSIPIAAWPAPSSSNNLASFTVDAVTDKSARALITSVAAGNFSCDFSGGNGITFDAEYTS